MQQMERTGKEVFLWQKVSETNLILFLLFY
jgi:hypothetical protein